MVASNDKENSQRQSDDHEIYKINSLNQKFTVSKMRETTIIQHRPPFHLTFKQKLKQFYNRRINPTAILKFLMVRFAFIEIMSGYRPQFLMYDCVAGIAVGFVHIAQGLAYGNLAGVNTASGLYVSLFAPLIYAIFGESRHLSIGTIAVMSLLIKQNTESCALECIEQNDTLAEDPIAMAIIRTEIASSLCLMVGIVLIAMAALQCGVLSSYLTDSLVSGYLCAAGLFVFTSQISTAFGFKPGSTSGFGVFFKRWYLIFDKISNSNPGTVVVFAVAVIPLAVCRHLNKRFIKKIKFTFPLEIIAIVIATIICSTTTVNQKYNISSIGIMPAGLPKPKIPPAKYFPCLGTGFVSVAIVTIAMNFSIVTRSADNFGYKVNMNQELFAYGITDMVTSFFSCFPACGAISRTAVGSSNHQKSQLASVVSSIFLIIITYTITEYLQHLPNAILAAIVIVTIIPTILQVREFWKFYNITKIEGLVWLGAFLATLLFDVDNGLFLSIIVSLLLNTITIQRPAIKVLGRLPCNKNVYIDKDVFEVDEIDFVKIILMEAPLVSYNAKALKNRVLIECGYPRGHNNPGIFAIHHRIISTLRNRSMSEIVPNDDNKQKYVRFLILDCTMMFAIDSNGLEALLELNAITSKHGTRLLLCGLREQLLRTASRTDFFRKFDEKFAFLTIQEAVELIETETLLPCGLDNSDECPNGNQ